MSVTRRNFIQAAGAAPLLAQSDARIAANDRIQIGFIGTGARAQELMQAAMANPGNEIVGLVDAYKGRAARALERTGGRAKVYPDYHELLAQNSIDAVVIATPDHWHRRMVLDTMPEMAGALGLYRAHGFVETDRYWDHPIGQAIFLERQLGARTTR